MYEKEYTIEFDGDTSVKGFDSNQVASNNPLEDRRSEASCLYTSGKIIVTFLNHSDDNYLNE